MATQATFPWTLYNTARIIRLYLSAFLLTQLTIFSLLMWVFSAPWLGHIELWFPKELSLEPNESITANSFGTTNKLARQSLAIYPALGREPV